MATRRTRQHVKRRRKQRQAARRPLWLRIVRWLVVLSILGALAGVGGIAGLIWTYGRDLPEIHDVQDYRPAQVSRVYAADGTEISTIVGDDAIVRTVASWDEIPQVMRDAILAAEDANFYEHPGLDFIGLVRAMVTNVRRGRLSQGASTITQQVVKNLVLSPERSIRRKIQEAILAFRLEDRLTKDEILTIYLNEVFFGSRYYGVEEAARYYFGHGASELTLEEAALLAGLVQSPNRYNPFRHPERALERRAYVLRQLWEKGFIEESVYRIADEAPLVLDETHGRSPWDGAFPFYADAVRRVVEAQIDEEALVLGGLRIETALDLDVQALAVDALRDGLRAFDARHGMHTPYRALSSAEEAAAWRAEHDGDVDAAGLRPDVDYRAVVVGYDEQGVRFAIGDLETRLDPSPGDRVRPDERPWDELYPLHAVFTVRATRAWSPSQIAAEDAELPAVRLLPSAEGALVAIDPTNRNVVALVGGYDFEHSSFNRAVQAERQVGSAFKPFVYGAALDARVVTAATVMLDQPVTFPMSGGESWQPRNYDGRFDGPMSVRTALARSRNVIAVRILDLVGLARAEAFTRSAGVEGELTDNLTLALGSAELTPVDVTNGYATFATGGISGRPRVVTAVRDADGSVLWQPDEALNASMSPESAWLTASLMQSVVERGTATRARAVGHPVAGKTGTTNGARDAWFVGFSRHLVTGVWVGRDDNETLGRGENGGATALPIWTDFMTRAHEGLEVLPFADPPPSLETARVDEATGLLARPGQDGATTEYFLRGTAPTELAPAPEARTVDDVLLRGGAGVGSGEGAPEPVVDDGF